MDIPWAALSMFALAGLSVVLILIILLQRGRGGGLAGAFGGAGGQSALGTRAGDVFTKITVGLAVAWIVLACVDIYVLRADASKFTAAAGAGATAGATDDADDGDADVPTLEPAGTDDTPARPELPTDAEIEAALDLAADPAADATDAADDAADAVNTPDAGE